MAVGDEEYYTMLYKRVSAGISIMALFILSLSTDFDMYRQYFYSYGKLEKVPKKCPKCMQILANHISLLGNDTRIYI